MATKPSELLLDGLHEVHHDLINRLLGIDSYQDARVLGVDQLFESSILKQLLLDLWVLVVILVDQPVQNLFVVDVFVEDVVVLVGHWVIAALL